jgi:uncharacterized cysteine cluster protein YcgN (CxxCxxCC family)
LAPPFWKVKPLAEMNLDEWESLCDGCAKCCLHKLEDMDTGEIAYTEVACRLLNIKTCRCRDYPARTILAPDCVELLPRNIGELKWMPSTCAYRLLNEGKDLPPWHYLVSGSRETVHLAQMSVRGRAVSERDADDLEDHIVDWPQ